VHPDPIVAATDPANEQPPSPDLPSLSSAVETGSVEQKGNPAGAVRIARVVSDVSMRAGPSKGQAVLTTISRGRTVDVISCRAWCEVIFAGQHGWIYKDFIAASTGPGTP